MQWQRDIFKQWWMVCKNHSRQFMHDTASMLIEYWNNRLNFNWLWYSVAVCLAKLESRCFLRNFSMSFYQFWAFYYSLMCFQMTMVGVFSFSFLNREYFGNKPMCAVINYFILVFDSGMFFNYMPLSTELVGILVSSNFSEIHSFPGCSHWEVSQKQETLLQKELVPEIYPTT